MYFLQIFLDRNRPPEPQDSSYPTELYLTLGT